jgi:menaquinol-cytochrome c reductase iron-sulfur subunit
MRAEKMMIDLLKYPGESENNTLPPEGKAAAHSRRAFLFKLSIGLNVAVGTVLAVPIVRYLIGSSLQKDANVGSWIGIGAANSFPIGETTLVDFQSPVTSLGDGQTAKVACWVRRISAQQFQVFAINCAHLGCPVRWFAQSKLFMCPCHGGAYYEDGTRAAGPPERGLFEYRIRLDGDQLLIHAGDMPTLATKASCTEKPLIQIEPTTNAMRS